MEKQPFCSKCGGNMVSFPQKKECLVRWNLFKGRERNVSGFNPETGETKLSELWACEENDIDSTALGYRNYEHDFLEVQRSH